MAVCLGARGDSVSLFALTVVLILNCSTEAAFTVSLELQGDCSDQLTLTCRHSDNRMAPLWIHNRTVEGGIVLGTAFPGAVYTVQALTEHTTTITGVDSARALDGHVIQCVYENLGNLTKSNAVKYSFIPPDYRPALSLVSFTNHFPERLSTFTYSYQESCSLYPRCTPYFSVEHTVSPQSAVTNSSSGCSVEYTIQNLMRCVSYQSNATTLIHSQRGNPVIEGDTAMLSPGRFTITSVTFDTGHDLFNVTFVQYEPDCPNYPTERYTVDVDGVQVANLTADAVQSRVTDLSNGFRTLSLPLSQPLPEDAVTLNMTKYNTVPTNRSDVTGNIVTEMVTWGTSAVFVIYAPALQESPPGVKSQAAVNDEVFTGVGVCFIALYVVSMTIFGGITAALCWKIYILKHKGPHCTCDGKRVHLPPTPGDPTPFADPTLSDDPTPFADPTLSDHLSTLQLQPNPSYCVLEMSNQQPMSSQLENEAEYVKYL